MTPLYWAISYEDKELVELLLARGSQINIKAKNEQTPLEWASSDDMREFLLKHGAKKG
jgi:ankyrin repeat protein